jgi:hypothetical protein
MSKAFFSTATVPTLAMLVHASQVIYIKKYLYQEYAYKGFKIQNFFRKEHIADWKSNRREALAYSLVDEIEVSWTKHNKNKPWPNSTVK